MSTEEPNSDRIGLQTTLSEIALPPALGERFATLYGIDDPPTDGREWVEGMRAGLAATRDRRPTVEDLCTTPDGEHAFVGADGETTYICVLDPLAYPFIAGETGTVRSTTPVREETVEFRVREDGVDLSHEDAVVSLGVSDHLDEVGEPNLEAVYRQVCGYIQTFADVEEYEQWAAEVDAETVALPAREGVAVAREIAVHLFDADADVTAA
jgi:hypothetical protein